MRIAVLDRATLGEDIDLSPIEAIEGAVVDIYERTDRSEIAERLSSCEVCIINKVRLDAEVLCGLTELRLICVAATGYDNVDAECCKMKGIALCNVAGYSSRSVAQLTAAMVLSASVHLFEYREAVASGRYSECGVQNILTPVYHELYGKTWGIIGYGGIGRSVAAIAEALGCRVKVCKRVPVEGVDCVSLEELLSTSDVISLHVPLSSETDCMIGERELSMMRDGVILVNAARGRVTDEAAVARAIKSGKVGFFGCDVYSEEPFSSEHPFYEIKEMKNVCLTPHMAWGAYESRQRCLAEIGENIRAFFSGEVRNRVV